MPSQPANKSYAIIVAGGMGTRMQSTVPKQFLLLNGKPVMMHTIEAFAKSSYLPDIIIVLPADFHDHWQYLVDEHQFSIPHQLVEGGETRFHSVQNALSLIKGPQALIAIQDAVRPLTAVKIIDEAFALAEKNGNAVVAVKSRDTVRQFTNGNSRHLNREEIYLVQTPQIFKASILTKAYQQPFDPAFTDDASVVERSGMNIHLAEGSYYNIKITYPQDIAIAETIQKKLPVD